MLVPGGIVVANEGHLVDVDREQVEPARCRAPSEGGSHRFGVAVLHPRVVLGAGRAADLEFPAPPSRLVTTLRRRMRGSRSKSAALVDCQSMLSHKSPPVTSGSTALTRGVPSRHSNHAIPIVVCRC
jgi:hypothetical protein